MAPILPPPTSTSKISNTYAVLGSDSACDGHRSDAPSDGRSSDRSRASSFRRDAGKETEKVCWPIVGRPEAEEDAGYWTPVLYNNNNKTVRDNSPPAQLAQAATQGATLRSTGVTRRFSYHRQAMHQRANKRANKRANRRANKRVDKRVNKRAAESITNKPNIDETITNKTFTAPLKEGRQAKPADKSTFISFSAVMKAPKGLARKQVLVPGHVLETFGVTECPGRHHGCVCKVQKDGADGIATIKMTDFKGLRIMIPISEAAGYLIEEAVNTEPRPKRVREEAAECTWKVPAAPRNMPTSGPGLEELIQKLDVHCHQLPIKPACQMPLSSPRFLRSMATSHAQAPVLESYILQDDLAEVILTHKAGRYLVAYYGEHSLMWVAPQKISVAVDREDMALVESLELWARKNRQQRLVKATVMEMLCAEKGSLVREIKRFQQLYDMETRYGRHMCHACGAPKAPLKCAGCDRRFHPLCLPVPALTADHLPDVNHWTCPCCDNTSVVDKEAAARASEGDHGGEEDGEDGTVEAQKMGLTPDWIIAAAAFDVFGLERPTLLSPVIKGLLDPCTNSKVAPNIPAEKLYDKNDNGLKLSNVWKGYYVVLNPDFTSQIQWRFVNRAIDEVESESVPAVILICRNSTDTAFYQRLRPYPRVNLKRVSVLFKDYSHTPIGFGISIFCMAARDERRTLYPKFFSAFGGAGEPLIPVDGLFVQTGEFWQLLDRLGEFTGSHHRDHWVKCSECAKWRIVPVQTIKRLENGGNLNWTCDMLDPPRSSCSTPLTKMEYVGGHYVVNDNEDDYDPEFKIFDFRTQYEGQNHARVDKKRVQEKLDSVVDELRRTPSTYKERTAFNAGHQGNVVDVRSSCALELSRKARIAANKAYLQALGSECRNNASGLLVEDEELITSAAKKLASHVAKTICESEVDKARFEYQQVMHDLAKEEIPLRRELERIRSQMDAAKRNIKAAESSAELIEQEFSFE